MFALSVDRNKVKKIKRLVEKVAKKIKKLFNFLKATISSDRSFGFCLKKLIQMMIENHLF